MPHSVGRRFQDLGILLQSLAYSFNHTYPCTLNKFLEFIGLMKITDSVGRFVHNGSIKMSLNCKVFFKGAWMHPHGCKTFVCSDFYYF